MTSHARDEDAWLPEDAATSPWDDTAPAAPVLQEVRPDEVGRGSPEPDADEQDGERRKIRVDWLMLAGFFLVPPLVWLAAVYVGLRLLF